MGQAMFVVGGESLIDLVSQPDTGDGVHRMEAHGGGSPYNCAIALARLGNESGFLCPISKDGFGDVLAGPLAAAGVHQLLVKRVQVPTTLAVVTLNDRGQARYEFYRGADRAFTQGGLIEALPARPELFQVGGFCPIRADDSAVWLKVCDAAAARGALIGMDPNVRPTLVDDFDAYRGRLNSFFDRVHLIKLSDEDMAHIDASLSVADHAAALLNRPNCELVVVTLGEKGALAFNRTGRGRTGIFTPPVFGDTVGAGDTLMAGILTSLSQSGDIQPDRLRDLSPARLDEMLRFGAVAAGLNCARKGANPPTLGEVMAVLVAKESGGRVSSGVLPDF
jgi:fructokinase